MCKQTNEPRKEQSRAIQLCLKAMCIFCCRRPHYLPSSNSVDLLSYLQLTSAQPRRCTADVPPDVDTRSKLPSTTKPTITSPRLTTRSVANDRAASDHNHITTFNARIYKHVQEAPLRLQPSVNIRFIASVSCSSAWLGRRSEQIC